MNQFVSIPLNGVESLVARTSGAYLRYRMDVKFITPEAKLEWHTKLIDVRRRKLLRCCEQQGYRCCYCGRKTWHPSYGETGSEKSVATLEHVVARSKGGSDSMNNLVMACSGCNYPRGDHCTAEEFYEMMIGLRPKTKTPKKEPDPEYLKQRQEHAEARQMALVLKLAYLTQTFSLWAWWDAWLTHLLPMLEQE